MVDAIVIGHLKNSSVWGDVATQRGSRAVSQLLRGWLGFEGVTVSDDLAMDAVRSKEVNFADVIRSAVVAGIDMVVVSRIPFDDSLDPGLYANSSVNEAIRSGAISGNTVERSYERIKILKDRLKAGFEADYPGLRASYCSLIETVRLCCPRIWSIRKTYASGLKPRCTASRNIPSAPPVELRDAIRIRLLKVLGN